MVCKPARVGNEGVEHEITSRLKVRGDVHETAELLPLRGQSEERGEGHVDERERALHGHVGEVADRDGDRAAALLGTQLGQHRKRGLDALHVHTKPGEG